MNNNYDDLEYCYQVLNSLKQLKDNQMRRNEINKNINKKRIYEKQIATLMSYFLIPFLVLFILILSVIMGAPTIIFVIIVGVGIIVYIALLLWWKNVGKRYILNRKYKILDLELKQVDSSIKKLVNQSELKDSRIPEKYLFIDYINRLINYLEKHQASFLEEAIYMMELDTRNRKYIKAPQ